MQSTHCQIKSAIIKKRRGIIIFADDFRVIGTGVAIWHSKGKLPHWLFLP